MLSIFDSHAHYFDERFAQEYPGGADAAINDSIKKGVQRILNAGTSPATSKTALYLAEKHDHLVAAVGIHPSDSHDIPDCDLSAALAEIKQLSAHKKAVAIGEIGLDYYWDTSRKDRQKAIFDAQLSLAEEVHLPVIIHDREAHGDTLDILWAHPHVTGVLHSFSGSEEMARQLVAKGWYVSFSGPLTYKNAHNLRRVAAAIPVDRILIETDAPYLPPEPHRGKMNYSGYLPFTLQVLADTRQISLEEAADSTFKNACRLFDIQ